MIKLCKIRKSLHRRLADEDGAITVDWVVLTGSLVVLGLVTISVIRAGVYDSASAIDERLGLATEF